MPCQSIAWIGASILWDQTKWKSCKIHLFHRVDACDGTPSNTISKSMFENDLKGIIDDPLSLKK